MSLKYGTNRFQPRAQDVSGQVGWTKTGAVVHLTTITDDVAIGATTMVGTEKVRIVGILRADDSVDNLAGLELTDGDSLPVSGAGTGRLRYNGATNSFESSVNGAAYVTLGDSGWTHSGTLVQLMHIGDTIAIGAAAMVGTEKVLIVGSLAFNASPGVTGTIRLTDANNITWFNGATTYGLVSGQGTTLNVGGPYPTRPPTVFIESATTTEIMSGALKWQTIAANTSFRTTVVEFGPTVVAPMFNQGADATAGVTCDLLTISSQSATDATAANYANGLLLKGGDVAGLLASTAGPVVVRGGSATAAGVGSLGGSVSIEGGLGATNGHIKLGWTGADYPAVGTVRMPPGSSIMWHRHGVGDHGITVSSGGGIVGGDAGTTSYWQFYVLNGGSFALNCGGGTVFRIEAGASSTFELGSVCAIFRWNVDAAAPSISHVADPTASVLCDNLLVQAQGATNAAGGASLGYGGQLRLSGGPLGGHADNKAGNVVLGLTAFTWAQCGNMEGGVVVAAAHAAPTANPSAGSKLIWSDSTGLNMRDEFGVVTLL